MLPSIHDGAGGFRHGGAGFTASRGDAVVAWTRGPQDDVSGGASTGERAKGVQ